MGGCDQDLLGAPATRRRRRNGARRRRPREGAPERGRAAAPGLDL